ncbi:hypothetical protein ACTFIW_009181 [Dictyostelium discoideum]
MTEVTTTTPPTTSTPTTTSPQNLSEEDKLWKIVQTNPLAFNQWTFLIGVIEKTNDIEKIRKVYSEFLNEFPLCFLYWKRFADHEYAHNNTTQSIEIFEKAVLSIPHSVDIWLNYCTHLIDKSYPVDEIRSVFKRGINIIGTDYQSGKFWEKYIEFEMGQENNELASIFNSILKIPLENLQIFNEKFKDNIDRIKINDMLTEEERKEYTGYDAETKQMVLQNREKWYHETLEKISKRSNFESIVNKRFFFHIQPIDEMTLSVWRSYFNYMESDPSVTQEEVIKLFERCLVPCCYYSEFWLKYIKFLQESYVGDDKNELIESIFERATKIFLKKRADIHLEYSLFVESTLGNLEKAFSILENIHSLLPTHLEVILRLVSFKRRNHSIQQANQFFKKVLTTLQSDSKTYPFLSINYISFLLSNKQSLQGEGEEEADKIVDVFQTSRDVLKKSISLYPDSKLLWLYFINFEINNLLFIISGSGSSEKRIEQIERIKKVYNIALCLDKNKIKNNAKDKEENNQENNEENNENNNEEKEEKEEKDDEEKDEDEILVCKLNDDEKLNIWNDYLEFNLQYDNDIKGYKELKNKFESLYPDGKPESKKRSLTDMNLQSSSSSSSLSSSSTNGIINNGNNDGPLNKRVAYSVPPTSNNNGVIQNNSYIYQQQQAQPQHHHQQQQHHHQQHIQQQHHQQQQQQQHQGFYGGYGY